MDVRFAGGLHYDPMSRPRCVEWLQSLRPLGNPEFVAVEWDSGIRARLEGERQDFRARWARFRGQDPQWLVDQLTESIAWEADVFRPVFGDLRVVWLEDGRDPPPSSRPLGLNRRFDWEFVLAPDPKVRPPEDVLPRLHQYCIEDAETTQRSLAREGRDAGRDKKWAETLLPLLGADGWSLVIVGALHASEWDDQTLFSLLQAKGHTCETEYLLWRPQKPAQQ